MRRLFRAMFDARFAFTMIALACVLALSGCAIGFGYASMPTRESATDPAYGYVFGRFALYETATMRMTLVLEETTSGQLVHIPFGRADRIDIVRLEPGRYRIAETTMRRKRRTRMLRTRDYARGDIRGRLPEFDVPAGSMLYIGDFLAMAFTYPNGSTSGGIHEFSFAPGRATHALVERRPWVARFDPRPAFTLTTSAPPSEETP